MRRNIRGGKAKKETAVKNRSDSGASRSKTLASRGVSWLPDGFPSAMENALGLGSLAP